MEKEAVWISPKDSCDDTLGTGLWRVAVGSYKGRRVWLKYRAAKLRISECRSPNPTFYRVHILRE